VHLDPRHQVALLATLRAEAARGVGIVVVMHDLGFAAQADRCVLLSNGLVRADGPPAEVLCADVLRDVYEIDVEVLRTADDRIVIAPMPQMTADASRPIRIEKKPWNHVKSS
jgi:iron complex transport system ATP-binding protein